MKQLVWIDTETQKVVPREPTAEMHDFFNTGLIHTISDRVYAGMLAAAPEVKGVELPPMREYAKGVTLKEAFDNTYARGVNETLTAIIRSKP